MNKYLAHFKTITKHKLVVFHQCRKCGLFWQGIIHDFSKYSPIEFFTSARNFQGNRSPIDIEKIKLGYSIAWQHHKGHNPHHWEYWIDFDANGSIIANKIPYKYIVEMICDWIGAGMVYNKEKWTLESPINYYNKVQTGRYFHPQTEELIIIFLKCIRDEGLEKFYKKAKEYKKNYE